MTRFAWSVAIGGLLALLGLTALVAFQPGRSASQAEVAHSIAQELRCPDCEGLSVADSSSQAAAEIRTQIAQQLAAGRTPDQVRQSFVDRYGEWILLAPAAPLLWVAPGLLLVLGFALLVLWLTRLHRPRPRLRSPAARLRSSQSEDAMRARVRDEAEALDA